MGRVSKHNKIDPDSERVLSLVLGNFKVKAIQIRIAFQIVREFMVWFSSQDTVKLRNKLVKKMTKGVKEHGPCTSKQAQKELEEEYLDLFGWTLKRDL